MSDIEYKDLGLSNLLKAMKGKQPIASVGVIGSPGRAKGELNNATIGAKHEFGDLSENLPIRSFLRAPISENLQSYLDKSGMFNDDMVKQILKEATFLPWVTKIGVTAEVIVSDAFDSGGFGKWKPSNMTFKKNHQTLVETQQLRNSITSVVK